MFVSAVSANESYVPTSSSDKVESHEVKQRNKFVGEAKASPFLDAVLLIYYYNKYIHVYARPPKPEKIMPEEVLGEYDNDEYEAAVLKSRSLMQVAYVGAAFHRYSSSTLSYDEAVAKMKRENPGFAGASYQLAVQKSIQAMR